MSDSDFRTHSRRRATDLAVRIDGLPCTLLDYSDGGVRIVTEHMTRRVALIEVFRGRGLIKKTAAVVAWRRGGQVGYAFRDKLKLCEVEGASPPTIPRRAAAAGDPGSISGAALRKRLNL